MLILKIIEKYWKTLKNKRKHANASKIYQIQANSSNLGTRPAGNDKHYKTSCLFFLAKAMNIKQIQANARKCKRMQQTNTSKQMQAKASKYKQANASKSQQNQANASRSKQIQASKCKQKQAKSSKCKQMQAEANKYEQANSSTASNCKRLQIDGVTHKRILIKLGNH